VAKNFYNNDMVSEDLMKGMIICSCLPMPSNMMIVLSISSKGDEPAALVLATTMNFLGVFVTPLLILLYLGEKSDINFIKAYKSISLRVLLPVFVGMILRQKLKGAGDFVKEKNAFFLMFRQRCLVFIVYTTFCHTFRDESDTSGLQFFLWLSLKLSC